MARKKHPENKKVKTDKNEKNEELSNDNSQSESEVIENNRESDGYREENGSEAGMGETANETSSEAGMQEKMAELQDRYLRLSADFDNFRKRTLREKIDLTKTAAESILIKLLPVLDDFERGLKVMETAADCKALKEGIDLVYSKFRIFLEQNGVKEIDALNRDFDVDMHDAVTKVPAPEEGLSGKVVDVIEKGYLLNDKVIRFSKVVVGE